VEAAGLLSKKNLILAGDLNLTTSSSETWGQKATSDPLSVYFKSLFQRHSLIDCTRMAKGWDKGNAQLGIVSLL
jgi:hypothetical protein